MHDENYFFERTIYKALGCIFFLSGIFLFSGCFEGCNNFEEQFNNGNSDPEALFIEVDGRNVRDQLSFFFGQDCVDSKEFSARVTIVVRTASIVGNQILPDPDPYSENIFMQPFEDGNPVVTEVMVPSEGAYALSYQLEVQTCTRCCYGVDAVQCGTNTDSQGNCRTGFPRVEHENLFPIEERPPFDQNYILFSSDFRVRSCFCGCSIDC